MTAVHNYDCFSFSAESSINRPSVVSCLLNKALYRRRIGTYEGHYPFGGDHISIADIDKPHIIRYSGSARGFSQSQPSYRQQA